MEFKQNRPIFLQIADDLCERILTGALQEGGRIPSVRETAAEFQVNPNTVVRSYNRLQERGIIHNRRGIGYFLGDDAKEQIRRARRNQFLEEDLPRLFRTMEVLRIPLETVIERYEQHRREI